MVDTQHGSLQSVTRDTHARVTKDRWPGLPRGRPGHRGEDRYFLSLSALRSRSSSPPHMKKACSGTWSYLPSVSALNASSVSDSGTNEPGCPVNASATN